MSANSDCIENAQTILVKMAKIIETVEKGHIEIISGENIALDGQQKNNLKQHFNALRVDCIKALNDVKLI